MKKRKGPKSKNAEKERTILGAQDACAVPLPKLKIAAKIKKKPKKCKRQVRTHSTGLGFFRYSVFALLAEAGCFGSCLEATEKTRYVSPSQVLHRDVVQG
jgi:hypothetical protein